MIKGVTFDNQNVTSKIDGGFYNRIFTNDGIVRGCSMSVTTNTLTIQPGLMIIAGRLIWIDSATTLTLDNPINNGYAALVLTIDLSQTATTAEFDQLKTSFTYSATTAFPELTQGNINGEGGDYIYQAQLAVVSLSGGNIANIISIIETTKIDADLLGGKTEDNLSVYNSARLGGKTEGNLSVYNSARLGGLPAADYAAAYQQSARHLYVNPNGTDAAGRGASDKPYKTLQYAYDNIPLNCFGDVTIHLSDGDHVNGSGFTAFENAQAKNIRSLTIQGTDSMKPTLANGSRFYGMFKFSVGCPVFLRGVTIMPPYENFADVLVYAVNSNLFIYNSRLLAGQNDYTMAAGGRLFNADGHSYTVIQNVRFGRGPVAVRAQGCVVILHACEINNDCERGLMSYNGALLSFSGTNSATNGNYKSNGMIFENGAVK